MSLASRLAKVLEAGRKNVQAQRESVIELDGLQKESTDRAEDRQIMMTLYSADLSPYSARVRMQIFAKGITDIVFELPENWGMPKFREIFPIGRVPVLNIDGDMMPRSEVIAEYLEEIYPEPSLLGTTPRETAHIRMLARVADIYIINNTFMLSRL